jgi:hypothetical protein
MGETVNILALTVLAALFYRSRSRCHSEVRNRSAYEPKLAKTAICGADYRPMYSKASLSRYDTRLINGRACPSGYGGGESSTLMMRLETKKVTWSDELHGEQAGPDQVL